MIVMVSGGYDPVHIGHILLLEEARKFGFVSVALNSDNWLRNKKGYCLMPWDERAEILRANVYISEVISVEDSDGTVCDALRRLQPDYFANGGDRTEPDPLEHQVCVELGIKELFNIGGGKIRSSSELIKSML